MPWHRIYSKVEHNRIIQSTLGNITAEDAIKIDAYNSLNNKPLINLTGENYLAKGHLSANAAFVYKFERDATQYYINVAPQFQSFNARNWKDLEFQTRNVAKRYTTHPYTHVPV